jgi:hypothetical protein
VPCTKFVLHDVEEEEEEEMFHLCHHSKKMAKLHLGSSI